jgi:hypothetical protein
MKITRRQLRKLIQESIYGRGKYKPGPVNPMTKIKTGAGTSTNRIPHAYQGKLDALASDLNTAGMVDSMAPLTQTPDLIVPFEGNAYEEKAFKGDSYDDELKKYVISNPTLLILPIEKEINKHIPNLKRLLDKKIGPKITSSSQLSYDWSRPIDGVAVKVDGKIIDLDNMSLLAVEALFGSGSEQHQKAKSLMPYDLYSQVVDSGGVYEIGGDEFISSGDNKLLFDSTLNSFSAYLAYKAITTGVKVNFGAEWIGAGYCNIGYQQNSSEPQEITFHSSNQLGPAIFNAAKVFDNITIDGVKILSNAKVTLT